MSYKPLFISLILIIIVGGIISTVIGGLTNIDQYVANNPEELSPIAKSTAEFMSEGAEISMGSLFGHEVSFSFNPFAITGDTAQEYITDQILILGVIPEAILIPILVFIIIGMIYSIIKLLPTT